MNNKKKETKVLCPTCGTEFAIPKNEFATVATVVGEDSGLGIVYPATVGRSTSSQLPKTVQERIEALRSAGIDVSKMFSIKGADGNEHIASGQNGMFAILDDNDPIFNYITQQGTVPNHRLFRRWVMAQMFHMMTYKANRSKEPVGVTEMIHRLGYEYQWKMLMNELYAQVKMEGKDDVNFADRNRWFNSGVVADMAEEYTEQLKKRVENQKERKCKGIPYKRIGNRNIFVSDLHVKLYCPFYKAIAVIKQAKNASQLYNAAKKFNDIRIKMPHDTPQSKAWMDAFKGSGAFFTMQNLIRFHDCVAVDDTGKHLDKYQSLAFIEAKAEGYKNGEGWRLLATLKKLLSDNNINVKKKMAEWRKKK
ncbi:ubiquitin carboxyl-hydrolase [Bacteroides fragilis]|uniref:ubiquitin carboxyl-hydrolase n=1 Tax=Bacteroides fragilis TaxID=817 RepID=UPI00189EDBD9|nr:ubiquitin carboxyl-hydrolase [Bacteroides fragilis]